MGVFLDSPFTGQTYEPPQSLDIAAIEGAIVSHLQSYLATALGGQVVEVTHFPDRPEAYEMRHPIGVAMVVYMGSRYGIIRDVGHVVHERTMEFEVGIRIRDLGWSFGGPPGNGTPGAYQVVDLSRRALLGFQPNHGCTPLRAINDRFVARDRQGGVWVYALRLSTRTVVVEEYNIPTWPLFIHGTMLEEGGVTSTTLDVALHTFNSAGQITLPQQNISGVVVKSQALSTTFLLGRDYTIDAIKGVITRVAAGGIAPMATVALAYIFSDVVTALASGGQSPFAPNN